MATLQRPRQARGSGGGQSQTLQPETFPMSYSENSAVFADNAFPNVPNHIVSIPGSQIGDISLTPAEMAMLYSSEPSAVPIVAEAYPIMPNSIGNQPIQISAFAPQPMPVSTVPPSYSLLNVSNTQISQPQSPFVPVVQGNSGNIESEQPRRKSGFRNMLLGMLEGAENAISDIVVTDEVLRQQRIDARKLEAGSFIQENQNIHFRELLPFRLNRTDTGQFIVSIAYGANYRDLRWLTIGNKAGYTTELEAIRIGEANSVPRWSTTQENDRCEYCGNMFGILFLRQTHHCRNCGRILCSKCSSSGVVDPTINVETHQGPVSWSVSMIPPSFQMNDVSPFEKQRCRCCVRCHKSLLDFRTMLKAGDVNSVQGMLEWTRALPPDASNCPRRVAATVNAHCPMSVFGENEYPIHLACESGNVDLVRYLLEDRLVAIRPSNAAPCIRRSSDGLTPFGCAANKGHVDLCLYLLQRHNCSIREVYNIFALWRLSSALLYGANFASISCTLPDATNKQEIASYIEMIEHIEGEDEDAQGKRKKKKALERPNEISYIQDMIDLPFVLNSIAKKAGAASTPAINSTTINNNTQTPAGLVPFQQTPQLTQADNGRAAGVVMYTPQAQLQLGRNGPQLTSSSQPPHLVEATMIQPSSSTTMGNRDNPYMTNHF